ncbi:MAG: hypothetical protein V1743_05525 [Nanoarchaeota archaeon]
MKQKKRQKAQAAMEFLTTYGWAFIIILTTIGALVYFGVLKWPISSRCIVSPEFGCVDYQVEKKTLPTDVAVSILLVNNMDGMINVPTATCIYADNAIGTIYHLETLIDPDPKPNASTNWEPGEKRMLTCLKGSTGSLISGEKTKVKFLITYYASDIEGFNHTVEGELVSEVKG